MLSAFSWCGVAVLASTPWADRIGPGSAAADEKSWLERWRGGWQLCAPSAGQASAASPFFHGEASQTGWQVVSAERTSVRLAWVSADGGVRIRRTWRLQDHSTVEAVTRLENTGPTARPVIVAEHLILGGDLLEPSRADGALTLTLPSTAEPVPLDYSGRPTRSGAENWRHEWSRIDRTAPGRVIGIRHPSPPEIAVSGPDWTATVRWTGLPNALLWQELGATAEPPWNSAVVALGIEPTTTPHGAGLDGGEALELAPGGSVAWTTSLRMTSRE